MLIKVMNSFLHPSVRLSVVVNDRRFLFARFGPAPLVGPSAGHVLRWVFRQTRGKMTGSVRQSLVRIITFDAGSVLIILGAHVDYYVVKCTVTDVQLQFWTNKSPCRIHNNPPGFLGQSLTLFDALLLFGELRFEDGARERGGVLHDGLRLAQRVPRAARPDRLHQQLLRRRVLPRRRQLPPRSLQGCGSA